MQFTQTTINFEARHPIENTAANQRHYEQYKHCFNSDCWIVFKLLMAGEHLTYKGALNDAISGDVRARVCDLRKSERGYGFHITDKFVTTETGRKFKEYFMTGEDVAYNLERLNEIIKGKA